MTCKIVLFDPETTETETTIWACEKCVFRDDNCGDDDHVSNDPLIRQYVGSCLDSPTSYYKVVVED